MPGAPRGVGLESERGVRVRPLAPSETLSREGMPNGRIGESIAVPPGSSAVVDPNGLEMALARVGLLSPELRSAIRANGGEDDVATGRGSSTPPLPVVGFPSALESSAASGKTGEGERPPSEPTCSTCLSRSGSLCDYPGATGFVVEARPDAKRKADRIPRISLRVHATGPAPGWCPLRPKTKAVDEGGRLVGTTRTAGGARARAEADRIRTVTDPETLARLAARPPAFAPTPDEPPSTGPSVGLLWATANAPASREELERLGDIAERYQRSIEEPRAPRVGEPRPLPTWPEKTGAGVALLTRERAPIESLGSGDGWESLRGDALAVLRRLPDASVDVHCSDPPYSSGTRREGQKGVRKSMTRLTDQADWFGSDSLTVAGFLALMRDVGLEYARTLKPGGHALVFIDWRMGGWLSEAIEEGGREARSSVDGVEPCPHCTLPVPPGEKFCASCGLDLENHYAEPIPNVPWSPKWSPEKITETRSKLGIPASEIASNLMPSMVAAPRLLDKIAGPPPEDGPSSARWPWRVAAALESADLRHVGMLVWDKVYMGMGTCFRNRHEIILHFTRGVGRAPSRRDVGTVLVHAPIRDANRAHPTVKPVPLLVELLSVVSRPGDLVVDIFGGVGSTGVAGISLGANVLVADSNYDYARIAARRLSAAEHRLKAT